MSARIRAAVAWIAIVAAALLYAVTGLRVNADFSAFLPDATTSEQRFLVSELKSGVASRLLLIELSGDTPERLVATSRTLVQALAADGRFGYVNDGDSDIGKRDLDVLRARRYLLSDAVTPERFTVHGLRAALVARLRAMAMSGGLIEKALLPEDPTSETLHLLARLAPATKPAERYGVWFSPDGARALLVAETKAAGSSVEEQGQAIVALERAFAVARASPEVRLRYSSPGAMAAQSKALIADDAVRLALVSTALIVAILIFAYRSAVVVLLCALPALTGLLVGVTAVDAAFGGVHAITLGFGATLLGEAVDYPGYLLTQKLPDEAATATIARISTTLAMAVLTTAGAAAALLLAGFSGLAQLGLLTMVGVLVAGAVTAWVLPPWVPSAWHTAIEFTAWWPVRPALSRVARRSIAVILAVALLAVAAQKTWWDDDIANMNPLPAELKQRDRELRAALGAPDVRWMLLIEGATRNAALETAERIGPALEQAVAAGALRGFELVSDYLPSAATQHQRQAALPDPAKLRERFAEAASGLPLRIEAFEPFFAAVELARSAAPVAAGDFSGTALGLKLDGLVRQDGGRWFVVVPLTGVQSAQAVAAAVAQANIPNVRWIDLQDSSRAMMAGFRARASAAFGAGALLIFAVLVAGLRDVSAALRVVLPVALAVAATAAAMVAQGSPLTVFHLVALMLVAGVGTNYALFVARAAGAAGPSKGMWRSLAVVAGTTLCAFGTLAFSLTPVLHAIGMTVTVGVVLSLAFTLLLAPSNSDASPEA